MNSIPTNSPSILKSDYVDDNTKVYADITGNLNVRSGPSTSYEVITKVTRNDQYTRIKKGVQNGERWDKVVLQNGIVGYVFQSYLKEVPNTVAVTDIVLSSEELKMFVNNKIKLEANIIPNDATDKGVVWETENSSIAQVSDTGEVTAKSIGETNIVARTVDGSISKKCRIIVSNLEEGILVEFDNLLDVNGNEISNLDLNNIQVSHIRELINTNMTIEIYNSNGKKLEENEIVGTGSKLVVKNNNGEIIYEYKFIIYGDVNGDGYINSLDVLVLQKHILEIKPLTGEFLKAGNISRNGNMPTSLDVLKIQKYILELADIKQGEEKSAVSINMFNSKEDTENNNEVSNEEEKREIVTNEQEENEQLTTDEEESTNNNLTDENVNNKDIAQKTEDDVAEKKIDEDNIQEEENSKLVEKNIEENISEMDEENELNVSGKEETDTI